MSALPRSAGSSTQAVEFLQRLEQFAATDTSADAASMRLGLLGWLRAEQTGRPSLGLVHQLCGRALDIASTAVSRGDSARDLRTSLIASCAAERRDLVTTRSAVAVTAAKLVTRRGLFIATLSYSSTVLEAILELARQDREPRVIVAEGRPYFEGRTMAAKLAAEKIPVWLVADAALPLLLSQTAMVWIGAESITDRGVINKIGSFAAALAAREHSVPVYALALRRTFLPATTAALRILEMSPTELWETPVEGVQARNIYSELVPLELLRGIAVEDMVLGITEAAQLARERELPGELQGG